ncbi:NnrU family protein [Ruixingdingia sedimenti]|uniref:NnrU family protein n=1 Tax=Ruixingdingia sedimenti TaxID=3073604 RepID=A0ABU1F8L6_9RHOB|nr:NnrU family protein [Xinfangfangia sp. LG-4]MDR5653223.1 NnrU family protein [Xinfangfangia sp. LG-4]
MAGWGEFVLAYAAFLLSHVIPTRPAIRDPAAAVLGQRGFTLAYSLLSVVLLTWLIVAAGRAPYVGLWDHAVWQRWAVNLAMPVALALVVFGLGAPNPLSFGGRAAGFDPDRPGIAGVARHPLLWALLLWASAHMIANGDLAHVLLFGGFALFSAMGMRMIDRRKRRRMPDWAQLAARTSAFPFAALMTGRWRPRGGPSVWRLAVWLAVWLALLWLHLPVIGADPLP